MIFIFPNTPQLTEYLQYNNPNVGVVRTGQIGDEYVQRGDNLPVINGFITLLEIPSDRFGVQISGFVEIDQDYYNRVGYIAENEILVYYPSGIVMFNPVHEGKTFYVNYEGRGVILLSADRVYMMYQKNPSVLVTLTDFANEIKSQLKIVNQRIKKYEEVAEYTLKIAEEARTATDQSKDATYHSIIATGRANDAADSTIKIYQPPFDGIEYVDDFYPNPENGFVAQDRLTGLVYRYDGVNANQWQVIEDLTLVPAPFASDKISGILRSQDFVKFAMKPIAVPLGTVSRTGVLENYLIKFPYDAIVESVSLSSSTPVPENTEISMNIQTISKEDRDNGNDNWISILEENIVLEEGQIDSIEEILFVQEKNIITKDSYLRFIFSSVSRETKGLLVTVNTKIKTSAQEMIEDGSTNS